MDWVFMILILLGFIVDFTLYVLATGKFARIDTREKLFVGDVKISFTAASKRMDLLSVRIDKILEVLEAQKGDIGLLAGDIADVKEEVGDIKLDIIGLQNAVNVTRPLEVAAPATPAQARRNGRKKVG